MERKNNGRTKGNEKTMGGQKGTKKQWEDKRERKNKKGTKKQWEDKKERKDQWKDQEGTKETMGIRRIKKERKEQWEERKKQCRINNKFTLIGNAKCM